MRVETIGGATLYLGDCREIFADLPAVNAVITDPPYDVEAHTKQRRVMGKGLTACRKLDLQPLPFEALTVELRDAVIEWSAATCSGWFLAFCQAESVTEWKTALVRGGLKWRRSGVWVKPDGMPQLTGDRPAAGHEAIAMAWCGKGRSQWNGGGLPGVWISPKSDPGIGHGGPPNEHPTQKPQRLMQNLVSLFTQTDDLVCDPFMGSGSTGVACLNLARRFIGIEVNEEYFEIACKRIRAAYSQQRLFA